MNLHTQVLAALTAALRLRNLSYQVDVRSKLSILDRQKLGREIVEIESQIRDAIAAMLKGAEL